MVTKCPYCAEEIQAEAVVCKHCNRGLKGNNGSRSWVLVSLLAILAVTVAVFVMNTESDVDVPGVAALSAASAPPVPRTMTVADNDALELQAGHFMDYSFTLRSTCTLAGRVIGLAGGNKDFSLLVMDDDSFLNWKADREAQVYFQKHRTAAVTLPDVRLDAGKYHLVVSNTFSLLTPKTVQARAQVIC